MISELLSPSVIDLTKLWPEVRVAGERIAVGIGIIGVFWILAKVAEYLICRFRSRMPHSESLLKLMGRVANIAIVIFGIATALGTMGINVSALVAGLGLTGFALGFAFRDILSNLLAGVLILLFRPFGLGDEISVTGLDGRVISIDLRYTILQQPDKIVLIPNSNLFTNPILVSSKRPAAEASGPTSAAVNGAGGALSVRQGTD